MGVKIYDTNKGYALAFEMKCKEIKAQKDALDQELVTWVNDNVIKELYPDLMNSKVIADYTNGVLTLHEYIPDEESKPEDTPAAAVQVYPPSTSEPEFIPAEPVSTSEPEAPLAPPEGQNY